MKRFVLLAFASGSLAALFEASGLLTRDTTQVACSDLGRKSCGAVCIEQSQTCCPDQAGGCPVGSVCWLGDNGKYGCCPVGKTCEGPGGSDITSETVTAPGSTSTSTSTIPDLTLPAPTTTLQVDTFTGETSTSETVSSETITTSVTVPAGTITPVPDTTAKSNGTAAPTTSVLPITAGAAVNGFAVTGAVGAMVVMMFAALL
ncbi:hypothetical protein NOR_00795 [Metarhizium rileyi]|uniref:GPI anchored serine-threonine rich protein n=1 Tax=Metarhizium rileyi (strain RCEF 4871) TaxID=1649241 RepID=A0A162HZP0_METRR|nr:hypothetical protein NOR_00795 [Metarhizium rileyi RCEF 4871]